MTDTTTQAGRAEVRQSKAGGYTVLAPATSLTHENFGELERTFKEIMEARTPQIILDCAAVVYMDSSALELLLDTHEALAGRGGILKLVGLNEVGRDALVATRLASVLHLYEDLHQALRSG